jgi:hypothetical protein
MLGAFLTSHTRTKVSLEKGVDDDFSSDSSVADDRELLMSNWHRRRQDKVPKLKILVSAFFVCVSYVGVFFFGWGMHPRRVVERVVHHPDLDKACLDHTSVYCAYTTLSKVIILMLSSPRFEANGAWV